MTLDSTTLTGLYFVLQQIPPEAVSGAGLLFNMGSLGVVVWYVLRSREQEYQNQKSWQELHQKQFEMLSETNKSMMEVFPQFAASFSQVIGQNNHAIMELSRQNEASTMQNIAALSALTKEVQELVKLLRVDKHG